MARELKTWLINKIVSEDGLGHKELREKVIAGEVTKEEELLILLRATTTLLDQKLDSLVAKVES